MVALDSNALTYLLDAVVDGYLPQCDADPIAPERVAMFRLFCYSTHDFWVSPTVRAQCERIGDGSRRELHDRWAKYQLEDFEPKASASALDRRARELGQHHADAEDCRIVAEAEAARATALLTADRDLIRNIGTVTNISIWLPSTLLAALSIVPGSSPRNVPASGNPLAEQVWWQL